MKKFTKVLSIVLAVIMIFSLTPANVQAASKKSQVNKSVNAMFTQMKKGSQKGMNTYVKTWGTTKPSDYNVFHKTYFKKSAKKITYKIKSTSVKGSTATVKVKVKYVNCYNSYKDAVAAAVVLILSDESITEEELENSILTAFATSVKQQPVKYRTQTITLKLKKSGSKWVVKNKKNANTLTNIYAANFISSEAALNKQINN